MWDSVKYYRCGLQYWKESKEKAIGVVTIYTVSDILYALYPKVLDTELVTFT